MNLSIQNKMDLVSGATGFIGQRIIRNLNAAGVECRYFARNIVAVGNAIAADLTDKTMLTAACDGIERIFHCAGYAHAFSSLAADDTVLHRQVNFEGTRDLVEAAGQAGVRRFVFLSSVKAMAEPGEALVDEDFRGQPETAYGLSKRAAEEAVLAAGERYGMHVVNLRLAMVYGAGGRGNLERMGRLVKRGIFPPVPETGNHRSLVHVDDVVSAMHLVASDDRANGRTYIIAAQEAPSGRGLFDALRLAQGMTPCNWSVPASLLRLAARLGDGMEKLGNRRLPLDSEVVDRLLNSAWYSPARIERELGWRAQVCLRDGFAELLGK